MVVGFLHRKDGEGGQNVFHRGNRGRTAEILQGEFAERQDISPLDKRGDLSVGFLGPGRGLCVDVFTHLVDVVYQASAPNYQNSSMSESRESLSDQNDF